MLGENESNSSHTITGSSFPDDDFSLRISTKTFLKTSILEIILWNQVYLNLVTPSQRYIFCFWKQKKNKTKKSNLHLRMPRAYGLQKNI